MRVSVKDLFSNGPAGLFTFTEENLLWEILFFVLWQKLSDMY